MTFVRLCLVAMALAMITSTPTQAQTPSKWSIKKLVPKMPKMPAKPKAKSEPSTLTKLNNNTKAFFAKSKALVPSWMMPETQERARQSSKTIQESAGRIDAEVRTARRKSLLPWLKKEAPEPEKPTTVSDFLALPKPGF